MAGSIATVPAAAISGRPCLLSLTATAGNLVRVWCVDAPPGSKLRGELEATGATQVLVTAADAGREVPFTADKGGAYVFRVDELTKGASAYGGVYDTDPNKAPSETLLDSSEVTLYFASPLTCALGVGQDTAELLLYVRSEQIIATSLELHGVVSPVLRKTKTGLAKVAAESAAVRSAVRALVGSAASAGGDTAAWLNSLLSAINLHLRQAGVHANEDLDNGVKEAFSNGTTTEAQKRVVAAIRKSLDGHMRNDDPSATPPGTGTGDYHAGAGGEVDWANALLSAAAPGDQLSVLVSAADAYRAFEAHRLSSVHDAPDTVNAAAAPSPLLALHVAFVRQLATQSPSNPANEHSAKSLYLSAYGFKEI